MDRSPNDLRCRVATHRVNLGPGMGHHMGEQPCAMLHKCANPECDKQYKYFSEGMLFEFQIDQENNYLPLTSPPAGRGRREIFWLCDDCAHRLTLECRDGAVSITSASRKSA